MINYFVHDVHASADSKLIRLRAKHKCAGYGTYWLLLEALASSPDGMLEKDFNLLGFQLNSGCDAQLLKSVIEDFGLFEFTEDKKYFYSARLNDTIKAINEKSLIAKEKAEKRWSKSKAVAEQKQSSGNTEVMQQQCSSNATAIQIKQDKIKEDNSINPPLSPQGKKTEEILLPEVLNFPEFKAAWTEWVKYRKEKHQALKESTVKSQIKFLASFPAEAVEMIQQSIRNGWTGLFELKEYSKALRNQQPKMTTNQELDVYKHFLEGGNDGK